MNQPSTILTRFWFVLVALIVALLAGVTWANYRFAEQNPGGNDFLVHWEGTRAFIKEGLSPYSDEVALRIQQKAYGHPARSGEHELRVAYPLYSTIFFAPFALVDDFNLARALWMTTLEVGLVLLTAVSIRLASWKISPLMLAVVLLFSLLWYHAARPLINGNVVILVALMMSLGFLAIRGERDELAGVLLAFTTIKPQLAVLPLLYVVVWSFSKRRFRIVVALVSTVVFLIAGAALFIPDWLIQNLREVIRYPGYNPPGTPGAAFIEWFPGIGRQLGWGLTILMLTILIVEWRASLRKDFRWFLWAACVTLVVSQWAGIQTDPGNFIILLPALILVMSIWDDRWGKTGRVANILSLLFLGVGLWALFVATLIPGPQPQQHAIMFFPLPFYLLVGLYWVRYWAIRPKRLVVQELQASEVY